MSEIDVLDAPVTLQLSCELCPCVRLGGLATNELMTGFEGGGGGSALTVSEKLVVVAALPPEAFTRIGKVPTGAVLAVLIVSVLVHVGVQLPCTNDAVAPEGNPLAENATAADVPVRSFALIVFVVDCPWTTVFAPPFESEKLKAGGGVLEALVSE